MKLDPYIREIADFPKPGVGFKDLTPLLADARAFATSIDELVKPFRNERIALVCGIEARGFIFGASAASALGCGFAPLRKPGKLPAARIGIDYSLEYGTDRLEIHADAVHDGTRVLLVDDVLATGGTLAAAAELLQQAGANLVGAAVVIELLGLSGRNRWNSAVPLHSIVSYD